MCDFVLKEWHSVTRLDVIWDDYRADSLKLGARLKRGSGVRRKVTPTTPIPRNWHEFLRNDENKKELFNMLSEKLVKREVDLEIIATNGNRVLSNATQKKFHNLQPCTHEEADTRIFLHAKDASQAGLKSIVIRTVDLDVVVLSTANFHKLDLDYLWILFGTGKNVEFIPIHILARELGISKSASLPFFHALTGCDNTSSFAGYGKKSAWQTFIRNPEFTCTFQELSEMPEDPSNCIERVDKFVVLMYDKSSSQTSVDAARKELFTKKKRFFDRLPPTRAALHQHILRSAYLYSRLLLGSVLGPRANSSGPPIVGLEENI